MADLERSGLTTAALVSYASSTQARAPNHHHKSPEVTPRCGSHD